MLFVKLHAEVDKTPKGLNADGTINQRSQTGRNALALRGDGRTVANAMARQIVHGPLPANTKANPRVVGNTQSSVNRMKAAQKTKGKNQKKTNTKGNNLNRGK